MPGKVVRGEVIEVNLDPTVGSEAKKTRPCVMIQNDVGNKFSSVTTVAPITGAENVPKIFPVCAAVASGHGGLTKDSVVQCDQIRAVDEKRFVSSLGHSPKTIMSQIDTALKISLALK